MWAEETSTYSWSRFCTVNCQPSVQGKEGFELPTSVVGGKCVTMTKIKYEVLEESR